MPNPESIEVPKETANGIANAAMEVDIPLGRESVYYTDGQRQVISDQMEGVPHLRELAEEIRGKVFGTPGPGYVVVKGLYSGDVAPSVNPQCLRATDLAPLDPEQKRAYNLNAEPWSDNFGWLSVWVLLLGDLIVFTMQNNL